MRLRQLLRCASLLSLTGIILTLTACGGGGSTTQTPPPPPPPPPPTLAITTSSQLPNGLPGAAYTATLQATGGKGTLTWSVPVGGNLPQWLSLNSATGTLTGTPTTPENLGFSLVVTDSSTPPQTTSGNFVLLVLQPLGVNTSFLATGNKNFPYDSPISPFGGTHSYTYTVTNGNLPPGLAIGTDGRITGTPTQSGSFPFTIQVVDAGPPQQTVTADVTIEVKSFLQILPANLAIAIHGRNFSQALQAVNGTLPLHWSVTGGPTGLSIDSSTGTLNGSPTQDGAFVLHVTATDSSTAPQSASIDLPLQVFGVLQITSFDLGTAFVGQTGVLSIPFSGGEPTVTAQSISTPPAGLSLNIVNTLVIASSNNLGDYSFDLKLSDSASPPQTAQGTFTLHVIPLAPVINNQPFPRGIIGRPYSVGLGAQRGTPPYTWSIGSGSLPDGLMLDSQGLIHGTPTTAEISSFVIHLVDSGAPAQTVNASFSIEVLAHALGRNDSIATATPITIGSVNGSISPFSDPSTLGPDGDYYRLTANPGATISVSVFAKRFNSPLDSVIEIVDGSGTRFTTCNDPIQPSLRAPAVLDPNPSDFNNSCINDDDPTTGTTDSSLQFKVPGTSGPPVTFYIHVIDFRGDARPDLTYMLQIFSN